MKNLYVVSSPFQCINAIEAKVQLGLKNNILIAVYYSHDGDEIALQMREVIKLSDWDEVIEVGLGRKRSKYLEYMSVIKKLKKHSYDNVFVGHFAQFQTVLLSNLSINNIYSIDDGLVTLKLHEEELNPNLKSNIKLSKKIKMLRYSVFGLKTSFDKKRINYFTMFDLKPYYNESIVKNEFTFMKEYSYANKRKDPNIVYFLGQPIYEYGVIEKRKYLEFIEFIKNDFKKRNIVVYYVPHRRESSLKDIETFEDEYFKIKKISKSIEIYLLTADILPSAVYSFMSTALFSVKSIFNIDATAVYLKKELLFKEQNIIEDTYKELSNEGVKILKIEHI